MSRPNSPCLGEYFGMLSSVSGLSREELERIGRVIGQALLLHKATWEKGSGSQEPNPSPTGPSPSVPSHQAIESDMDVPKDFIPTQAEEEEINRVVSDGNFAMSFDKVGEEDEPPPSLITRISQLEKTQDDILTLLRSLNN